MLKAIGDDGPDWPKPEDEAEIARPEARRAERDFIAAARAYCEVWFRHNRADARTRQSLSDAYRNLVKIELGDTEGVT